MALGLEVIELATPVKCGGGGRVEAAFAYGVPVLFLVGMIAWAVARPKGVGPAMTVVAVAVALLFPYGVLRFGKCFS